ncbi:unnamed protein product [Phytophthora fragariaefolia]|uniref:Unnamed protein product n=1 Tax=Phytophthora fragariaefolia TaxID=1490495 RepID=A0A9W7D5I6_9STRA|nr:unnamed protein product [Phytophthora fragariaefolia]
MIITKKNAPAASSNARTAASTSTTTSSIGGALPTRPTDVAGDVDLHAIGDYACLSPTAAGISVKRLSATSADAATSKVNQRMQTIKSKRKKCNKVEKRLLLRQVNADYPYKATRGRLMDAWAGVARKLQGVKDFAKTELTSKSAHTRFNVLFDRHRDHNKVSAAASGVSEDYDETIQLLDDLLLQLDEHAKMEELKSEEPKEKLAAEENTGKYIRDEAVSPLKKRKEREDESEANASNLRKLTVFEIMREDNEKERKMRAAQWKQEQEMLRQHKEAELNDRKEEREFRLRIARLENERFKMLLQLAKIKFDDQPNSVDGASADMDGDC